MHCHKVLFLDLLFSTLCSFLIWIIGCIFTMSLPSRRGFWGVGADMNKFQFLLLGSVSVSGKANSPAIITDGIQEEAFCDDLKTFFLFHSYIVVNLTFCIK